MNECDKAAAWDVVAATLDAVARGWNDPEQGVRTAADAARSTILRLAHAAATEQEALLRGHVRNELVAVRALLERPDLQDAVRQALQVHLLRLARIA